MSSRPPGFPSLLQKKEVIVGIIVILSKLHRAANEACKIMTKHMGRTEQQGGKSIDESS